MQGGCHQPSDLRESVQGCFTLLLSTKSFPPTGFSHKNQMQYVYPVSCMFLIYKVATGKEEEEEKATPLLCSETDRGVPAQR